MMRISGFIKRIKACASLLFKKNARIMTCGNCGSTDIVPISNSTNDSLKDDNRIIDELYTQYGQCRKCGAVCYETQAWNYSGNVKELGFHKFKESKQED